MEKPSLRHFLVLSMPSFDKLLEHFTRRNDCFLVPSRNSPDARSRFQIRKDARLDPKLKAPRDAAHGREQLSSERARIEQSIIHTNTHRAISPTPTRERLEADLHAVAAAGL